MAKSRARKLADIIVGAGIDIDGNLTFDGGSTSADLTFADNDKANFGDASDLQIYHNGSHSFIKDAGTGDLYIGASNNLALMNSAFSENYLLATTDGAVTLYYDGSSKLATSSSGVSVTGHVSLGDSNILKLGTGSDLQLYHDGSNSSIQNSTGNLYLYGGGGTIYLKAVNSEDSIVISPNAGVSLYYDNSAKFATTSAGIDVTGSIDVTSSASYGVTANRGFKSTADIPNFTLVESDASGQTWQINSTGAKLSFRDISRQQDRIVIDTAGRVGIGTTSPSAEVPLTAYYSATSQFHIGGAQAGISNNVYYNGSAYTNRNTSVGGALLQIATDGSFAFRRATSGSSPTLNYSMYIDSLGKVGIGTTSPGKQLTINGADAEFLINRTGSYADTINMGMPSGVPTIVGGTDLAFGGTGTWTEHMRIKADGNVGIGISAPTAALSVVDTSQTTTGQGLAGLRVHRPNALSQYGYVDYDHGGGGINVGSFYSGGGNSVYGTFMFRQHNAAGSQTPMAIGNTGNVGFGTTSPADKIHLATGNLLFERGQELRSKDTGGNLRTLVRVNASNELEYGWSASGPVKFMGGTSYTERMRIHTNGYIGINQTNPTHRLQVAVDVNGAFIKRDVASNAANLSEFNSHRSLLLLNRNAGSYLAFGGTSSRTDIQATDLASTPTAKIINLNPFGGNVGIGRTDPSYALDVQSSNGPTTARFSNNDGEDTLVRIIAGSYNTELDARLFLGEADTYGMTMEYDGVANIGYIGMNDNVDPTGSYSKRIQFPRSTTHTSFMAGNVGIGTSSPANKLEVKASGNDNGIMLKSTTNVDLIWLHQQTTTEGVLRIYGSGSAKVIIPGHNSPTYFNNGNNFGIGTTSPNHLLTVAGTIAQYSSYNDAAKFLGNKLVTDSGSQSFTHPYLDMRRWTGSAANHYVASIELAPTNADAGSIVFYSDTKSSNTKATTERMRIDSSGNVGIGTTSPGATLHTVAKAGTTGLLVAGAASNNVVYFANSSGVESFVVNADGKTKLRRSGSAGTVQVFEYGSGQVGGIQVQSTGLGVGGAARENDLFIKTDGKVGIGTTTPSQALHVVGQIYTSGTGGTGYFDGHRVILESTSSFANIGTDAYQISNVTTDGLVIGRNTSRLVTVKPNGNVGVGVDSPDRKLHVGGSIKVGDDNAYEDTGDNFNGGVVFQTPIYTEYQWKWNGADDHETNLYCGSYFMAEIVFTQHQTNGGTDINRHLLAKWANNHTHHELETIHDSGSTWSMTTSITATDHNLIATGGSGTAANGRLRIVETYDSGSYSFSTLTVRVYTGALSNVTHTYG